VRYDDPGLAIRWPVTEPTLSDKDRGYQFLDPARTDLPSVE
jgi:dTDP-4-dehydrorhamnose 3,5-epimerase-like enzyme